jgi:hypothetical protein
MNWKTVHRHCEARSNPEIKNKKINKLCEPLWRLCGSLCNKKNYTELHGEGTELHRGVSGLLRSARNDGSGVISKGISYKFAIAVNYPKTKLTTLTKQ